MFPCPRRRGFPPWAAMCCSRGLGRAHRRRRCLQLPGQLALQRPVAKAPAPAPAPAPAASTSRSGQVRSPPRHTNVSQSPSEQDDYSTDGFESVADDVSDGVDEEIGDEVESVSNHSAKLEAVCSYGLIVIVYHNVLKERIGCRLHAEQA